MRKPYETNNGFGALRGVTNLKRKLVTKGNATDQIAPAFKIKTHKNIYC